MTSNREKTIIIGAGEQGRVMLDYLKAGGCCIGGFLDDDEHVCIQLEVKGYPVLGKTADAGLFGKCSRFSVALGDNHKRGEIMKSLWERDFEIAGFVHPSAIVSKSAGIGRGTVIGPGAIICNEATIGDGAIIDSGSIVEHDCRVSDFVNLSPGSLLVSGNRIGRYSWIGARATINEDVNVGENCIVGASSLVTRDVPDNVLAFGIPAKAMGVVDANGRKVVP